MLWWSVEPDPLLSYSMKIWLRGGGWGVGGEDYIISSWSVKSEYFRASERKMWLDQSNVAFLVQHQVCFYMKLLRSILERGFAN